MADALQGMLSAFSSQAQWLENSYLSIYDDLNLTNGFGEYLDSVGQELYNINRLGRSDADYRTRIFLQTKILSTKGDAESIREYIKELFTVNEVMVRTYFTGASFTLPEPTVFDQSDIRSIKRIRQACHDIDLVATTTTRANVFRWAPVGVTLDPADGKGWGAVGETGSGGIFSTVLE